MLKERNKTSFSLISLFQRVFGRLSTAKGGGFYSLSKTSIERLVGFKIGNKELYERAMMHRSLLRGEAPQDLKSNERLEFLGDAVLGFITAEHLFAHFPEKDEGFLTRLRAKLVNGKALAECAQRINLGELILMSKNMAQEHGRRNATILADAFEALIGAIYLDQGLEKARLFIHTTMLEQVDLTKLAHQHDNYKSLLLEYAQARGWSQPQYRVVTEQGPSHAKLFTVEAILKGEPYGSGKGGSKKLAEQRAAKEALLRLRGNQTVV